MGTRVVKKVGIFDSKETIAAKVPLGQMVIGDYQGHVHKNIVDKIVKGWDDSAAGAIILNWREDDTYAVLDGQHRVLAARKVGKTELNALVFVGKTREEEARLFVQLNTKHNVSSIDRFRANLKAGEVREKTIRAALREVGLDIQMTNKKSPDSIAAAAALTRLYDNFGIAMLKTTLGVLTSAFKAYPDRAKGYSQSALIGTAQFLYRYPEADVPRLIEKLKAKSPTTLVAMGDAKLDAHSDLWQGWGKMLVSLYNSGVAMRAKAYLHPSRMESKRFAPKVAERMASPEYKQKLVDNARRAAAKADPVRRLKALELAREASRKKFEERKKSMGAVEMTVGVRTPLRSTLGAAAKASAPTPKNKK